MQKAERSTRFIVPPYLLSGAGPDGDRAYTAMRLGMNATTILEFEIEQVYMSAVRSVFS